jgi:hypothetical protein
MKAHFPIPKEHLFLPRSVAKRKAESPAEVRKKKIRLALDEVIPPSRTPWTAPAGASMESHFLRKQYLREKKTTPTPSTSSQAQVRPIPELNPDHKIDLWRKAEKGDKSGLLTDRCEIAVAEFIEKYNRKCYCITLRDLIRKSTTQGYWYVKPIAINMYAVGDDITTFRVGMSYAVLKYHQRYAMDLTVRFHVTAEQPLMWWHGIKTYMEEYMWKQIKAEGFWLFSYRSLQNIVYSAYKEYRMQRFDVLQYRDWHFLANPSLAHPTDEMYTSM